MSTDPQDLIDAFGDARYGADVEFDAAAERLRGEVARLQSDHERQLSYIIELRRQREELLQAETRIRAGVTAAKADALDEYADWLQDQIDNPPPPEPGVEYISIGPMFDMGARMQATALIEQVRVRAADTRAELGDS